MLLGGLVRDQGLSGCREYQMANQSARLMVRSRGAAMVLTAIVLVLCIFVDYGTCSAVLASQLMPCPSTPGPRMSCLSMG